MKLVNWNNKTEIGNNTYASNLKISLPAISFARWKGFCHGHTYQPGEYSSQSSGLKYYISNAVCYFWGVFVVSVRGSIDICIAFVVIIATYCRFLLQKSANNDRYVYIYLKTFTGQNGFLCIHFRKFEANEIYNYLKINKLINFKFWNCIAL